MHDMIKKLRNIHVICTNLILLSLLFLGFGCNDDKEVFQTGNGYVQFKVYKSASYVKMRPLVQVEMYLIHFMRQIK